GHARYDRRIAKPEPALELTGVVREGERNRGNARGREGTPTDARLTIDDTHRRCVRRNSLGHRAGAPPQSVDGRAEHREHWYLAHCTRRLSIERERRLERREGQLVDTIRACERIPAQRRDRGALADDDPRLGATKQLVAAHRDERRSGAQRFSRRRLTR